MEAERERETERERERHTYEQWHSRGERHSPREIDTREMGERGERWRQRGRGAALLEEEWAIFVHFRARP